MANVVLRIWETSSFITSIAENPLCTYGGQMGTNETARPVRPCIICYLPFRRPLVDEEPEPDWSPPGGGPPGPLPARSFVNWSAVRIPLA